MWKKLKKVSGLSWQLITAICDEGDGRTLCEWYSWGLWTHSSCCNLQVLLFKVPLQSHGYILPHLASDSMCSQHFCTEQKMKEPWDGSILCRMTYCVEHPTRKMLLVPVEPAEPNPHCYVCSEVFSSIWSKYYDALIERVKLMIQMKLRHEGMSLLGIRLHWYWRWILSQLQWRM
jgi:hypothetical protein